MQSPAGLNHTGNMLMETADGVLIRQSSFCQSNAVVVGDPGEVLLVDPGVDGDDLVELADDLDDMGAITAVGFSTHPHWDHVLWHTRFGEVQRYGTRTCAAVARARLGKLRDMAAELAPGAPLDLLGAITALPEGSVHVPLRGRSVRVIEHQAHAPGHAALLIDDAHVLVAGDMLSDVEIPLLDPTGNDQCNGYLAALDQLEAACRSGVTTVVPGHGSVARGAEIHLRIESDRAYIQALQAGVDPADPRVGPNATYGTDWLPEAHQNNLRVARQ
jgi:glyoxylase-like metal-dependent hydrolase (beta-lactamase superfamily II)